MKHFFRSMGEDFRLMVFGFEKEAIERDLIPSKNPLKNEKLHSKEDKAFEEISEEELKVQEEHREDLAKIAHWKNQFRQSLEIQKQASENAEIFFKKNHDDFLSLLE